MGKLSQVIAKLPKTSSSLAKSQSLKILKEVWKPEQPEQKGVEKGIQNLQEQVIKPPELVKETNQQITRKHVCRM